ncbi:hypothetical protein QBL02_04565 [Leucobacter sp. UT-8R-CII-1-4]|uniref:hypothetical protein n=1 Tax=Leucobacter sp. UT-8R-CII-1-4 TaxID=3040075 RepID=UPI0024A9D601|nr:hypothetical protein [Leucobacter sp. UT-8R-CII-1-4]MDI6022812.1 hypothetical protein [Leucobacter sp. UT-8R-CII-1-4]
MSVKAEPDSQAGVNSELKPELKPETPPNSWFNTVLQGLSYGLLGIALAASSIVVVIPKFAGAVPVTILSDSMAPSMPVGSLAIIKPNSPLSRDELTVLTPEEIRARSDFSSLQLGAVVAYQPDRNDPTIIIHRIVSMTAHADGVMAYTTKGDNNRVPDRDKVSDYQIRGTVWYHLPPPIGTFNTWLNHDEGNRSVAIIGIAVVGYAWALFLFGRAIWRHRANPKGLSAKAEAKVGAQQSATTRESDVAAAPSQRLPKRRELRSKK